MSDRRPQSRGAGESDPGRSPASDPEARAEGPRSARESTAGPVLARRGVLAGLLGVTAAAGGCVQRLQNIVGRDGDRVPSVSIKTMPADADEQAVSIARRLSDNLAAVGVESSVTLQARSQLYRDVLLNHDFEAYVARFPGRADPDFLRPLCHSRFTEDLGWQNPFGFVDLDVDELLERQRTVVGGQRRSVVADVQREVVSRQPFAVVAVPDVVRAARPDRFRGWDRFDPASALGYLRLRPATPTATPGSPGGTQLRLTTTDERATENFNPLMVEFRTGGAFTDLVYDRLARRAGGAVRPWLAGSVAWETDRAAERQRARVELREGARWHDGLPVTAGDVAFTYRLLADTWLGAREVAAPAPRFHGRVSLVEDATAVDDRTVRIAFGPATRSVAARALCVPVLPEREWAPRAREPDFAGLDLSAGVTEALVWNNPRPVGSGPLRFESRATGEQLVLSRFEDHFLHGDGAAVAGVDGVPFDQLSVRVVPSDAVAVDLVAADRADATATSVDPAVAPRIGRAPALALHASPSDAFYHVGFNARRAPTSNPRFRRSVARLLDRETLVADVFEDYATPAVSPLAGDEWLAPGLEWSGTSPVLPFFGEDGDLALERAREAFREAGYRLAA